MEMEKQRQAYHQAICKELLLLDKKGIPSNADRHSILSVALATGILREMGYDVRTDTSPGQTSGKIFERLTANYLEAAFRKLLHIRPGAWQFTVGRRIEEFEQYEHLAHLSQTLRLHPQLRATLGDYLINPDIVIGRTPIGNDELNEAERLLMTEDGGRIATLTPLLQKNSYKPILHASISCKWTIRSDRSQNARTEGLNLIRNRKGHTPHIVIVTAELYPQRIASLSLGTGDIDCVYHFALPELQQAARFMGNEAVLDMLDILVSGKRLRDISDLPLDLAI